MNGYDHCEDVCREPLLVRRNHIDTGTAHIDQSPAPLRFDHKQLAEATADHANPALG
jgi:hypothetical protein